MTTKLELVFDHCNCDEPGIDETMTHSGEEVVVTCRVINTTSCENHLPNYLKAGWSIVE